MSAATAPPENANGAELNGEHPTESAYIKEIQKQVRSISKKLAASAKLDAVLAENPNSTLDELLSSKKINADQKAQALKKPGLQSQLAQLEEQLAQYKKVDADYQSRLTAEKKSLQEKHDAELAKLRGSAQEEGDANTKKLIKQKFLLFSRFLRAAAAKRISEEEADTEESRAFEGALLLVYGGDEYAVQAAENIVEGTDEIVTSVEGKPTSIKYSQLKELTLQHTADIPDINLESTSTEPVATEATSGAAPSVSDPTITHAGLTELADQQTTLPVLSAEDTEMPAQSSTGDEGANSAAGQAWTGAASNGAPEEANKIVPRDPAETDIPQTSETAAPSSSWADDAAEAAASTTPVVVPDTKDDGFHQVQGRRGGYRGQRGDGEARGRGGRGRGGRGGGDRGRGGYRGDRRGNGEGRGRGRGAPRGS